MFKHLVRISPDSYLLDLASALNNLSGILGGMGRWSDALAVSEQAVTIFNRMRHGTPDAMRLQAVALINLSNGLQAASRRSEAVAASRRAVTVAVHFALAHLEGYPEMLVASLVNLSHHLGIDRRAEAEQAWGDAAKALGHIFDLGLIWAGWKWISTRTLRAERDFLVRHPELLAAGAEDQLRIILRYKPGEEEQRYLALLATARLRGVDAAYRDLCVR
jgi:hypothetical protein